MKNPVDYKIILCLSVILFNSNTIFAKDCKCPCPEDKPIESQPSDTKDVDIKQSDSKENKEDEMFRVSSKSIDNMLQMSAPSVMDKEKFVDGIDQHDYVSYASYWWPNPDSANGLPYIRKDGVRNKELVSKGDAGKFHSMAESVVLLTLEFKRTSSREYADKAVQLLQTWFLNPDTLMNPNLDHGQMIMGKNTGTKSGLIELRYMISLVAVIPILEKAGLISKDDKKKLHDWFERYYKWLVTSKLGKQAATKFFNNHGTWHDAQLASIALFLGNKEHAKKIFQDAKQKRIAKQIKPDGRQPLELERTRSLTYSLFNLEALFILSKLAERVGVDLWNYETPDGRGINKAYKYVLDNKDAWPSHYKQIDQVEKWRWDVLEHRDAILYNVIK